MMQPFGQVPAFEDGDLKLFGKIYMNMMVETSIFLTLYLTRCEYMRCYIESFFILYQYSF